MSSTELRYGTPEEAGMLPDRIEHVKRLAEDWVTEGHTPSLVVLAARRGVICLHEAYGVLTPDENSPPLLPDSIFPLSSITKPITATAIMILVEDGLLGLNRPVVDYIPEICGEGTEEILVHHLLTHTSGYNDESIMAYSAKRIREKPEFPECEETQHPIINELLFLRYPAPLSKPPGVEASYSNHNYLLLGEIVRRISGYPLANFASRRIFLPLGMNDTDYTVTDSRKARVVKRSPDSAHNQPIGIYWKGIDSESVQKTPYGYSGVWSTAYDMAIFGQMFLNFGDYGENQIISRPTVSEMIRNQIPGIGTQWEEVFFPEASVGFGWLVHGNEKWKNYEGSLHSQNAATHPGLGGVRLWVDPENEIVGCYFAIAFEVASTGLFKSNFDLFQNAITASVSD